jgi:Bifunctional DNA primase/polymerase, N-terminal
VTAAQPSSAGLLAAAVRYAAAGWPVFPCVPGGKEPDTLHGFKDATTNPAAIRAWWRTRPDRNVAIATGAPGPDVLDVDVKHGDGRVSLRRLAEAGLTVGACALVRTRSGGLHLYYQGTSQASGRLPRHDVDFRACGGYVVAPPSFVDADDSGPAGSYEVVEKRAASGRLDWAAVRQLLDPRRPVPARAPWGGTDLAGLVAWVAGLPEGNRNDGLFWAACRAAAGGATDLGGLVAAAVSAGLPEGEAWRTIRSAERTARP